MSKAPAPVGAADILKAASLSEAVERYRASIPNANATSRSSELRLERKTAWLRVAVPSLLGSLETERLCHEWSLSAEELLTRAFNECFSGEIALFALGKLGARELNLSSDVDLMIISRSDSAESLSALRRFQRLLSDITPEGFVFRTDFDLRPGGRMGPVIPTLDQFVDYYGNYGETWERMAFVRLRGVAGDQSLQKEVLDFAARFSFRRHLDFNLFEELKLLRTKIHHEHWLRNPGEQVDLKLGVGGIRDVELFIHALQVIHGGKDPELRERGTSRAARELMRKNLLPLSEGRFLIEHYWNLRALENFVQSLGDEQTHLILKSEARLPESLRKIFEDLEGRMKRTDEIVATLLGKAPTAPSAEELRSSFSRNLSGEALQEILAIPLLSRHKERDERTRRIFLERFLSFIKSQNANEALALDQLKDFLKAIRAKASFFALLVREEKLVQELAWLFGHSRYLGRLLCFRPELLDSFIFRSQDLPTADLESLLEALAEKKLLSELIEGSHFLKTKDIAATTQALTNTADDIVKTLSERMRQDHPSRAAILALGKWGGRETGFRSDLDLIFVHPGDPDEADLKFAKRVISRLTDSHRGGSIYPVDLRLRPSGKAGPLVISWKDLELYLRNEAAPWERQAYLRGRWLSQDLGDFKSALVAKKLTEADLKELNRIRQELVSKRSAQNPDQLDIKFAEGGLVDIELFAQTRVLQSGKAPESGNTLRLLEDLGQAALGEAYSAMRRYEQIIQLISLESTTLIDQKAEFYQQFAPLFGHPSPDAAFQEVRALLAESANLLQRLDPRRHAG